MSNDREAKKGHKLNPQMFISGGQDCKQGVPHKQGMGESYDRGYAAQYELEQVMNERHG